MRKFILSMLSLVALVSCSKSEDAENLNGELRIAANIVTRASGTTWASGDDIGVFMSAAGGSLGELGANVLYTTVSGDGNFSSTSPLKFPAYGNVDLFAYYPFVDSDNFDPMSYDVDVTSQASLPAIDLLVAKRSDIVSSNSAVGLTFNHKLSNIRLSIAAGNGVSAADLKGVVVKLVGTKRKATYDLTAADDESPITLNDASVGDVVFNVNGDGTYAEAIVVPQELSDAKITLTTDAYGTFEASLNTAALEIGMQYNYNVTVSRRNLSVGDTIINDWGNGDEGNQDLEATHPDDTRVKPVIGDYYYSDGTYSSELDNTKTPIGLVFWVGNPAAGYDNGNGYSFLGDPKLAADHPNCVNGLVVALDNVLGAEYFRAPVGSSELAYHETWFINNKPFDEYVSQVTVDMYAEEYEDDLIAINRIGGYNNTKGIEAYNVAALTQNPDAVIQVESDLKSYKQQVPTTQTGSSGWYIPSIKELTLLMGTAIPDNNSVLLSINIGTNSYGTDNATALNAKLSKLAGADLIRISQEGYYLYSSNLSNTSICWYFWGKSNVTVPLSMHVQLNVIESRFVLAF